MIQRSLLPIVESRLFRGKVIIIVGPRQVGKTTLLRMLMQRAGTHPLYWNCDEPDVRQRLSNATSTQLASEIGGADLVLIDEAQRVENIGLTLKLIIDNLPGKQLVVTGSSALELSNTISEPLTGRKYEYILLPLSADELIAHATPTVERRLIEARLIYGTYPDVVNHPGEEREILTNIVGSYLYKDIFAFRDIRKPEVIERLLQAIALQVGSEVSFNELGRLVGLNTLTVQRYLDLMEKSYIIFHLHSFSRNVRTELKKSRKLYFYDTGVRNAIIGDFKPLALRQDTGALWENYLICERLKHNLASSFYGKGYFWRTTQQQEIDYLEDIDGTLHTYEFKWRTSKKSALTTTFASSYPQHTYHVVGPDNYQEFISGKI